MQEKQESVSLLILSIEKDIDIDRNEAIDIFDIRKVLKSFEAEFIIA